MILVKYVGQFLNDLLGIDVLGLSRPTEQPDAENAKTVRRTQKG